MTKRIALALILFSICWAGAMTNANEKTQNKASEQSMAKPVQLSPGVYDVPIVLSKSLEGRRSELRQDFIRAQRRLRAFASKNGWEELTDAPFVKQVDIYDSKQGFDKRCHEVDPKGTPAVIPKTYSAAIESDIFFSVSPDVYLANYPEGKDADFFEKLMTHELAHRLHIRILKGDEEKMGPMWFFEGFAVYAADQLNHNPPKLSESEIWSIVDAKERGSYKKYNVVFRHFLQGVSLPDYVQKASQPDFNTWLKAKKSSG